ncbi:hypothetical protein [Natranaerobius thermophilus]|uniref:Uncharacterized protein n=1 Tax=Natranaerobius thermophilus (strain ATCC BAA-1301 / DSM 18059 / JW/NM-WN-LF) TaxID=457570 RepID=B2A164_NATTJ|nr:hypothetical protein [Natranaerobius thermophilus]ACB86005.1 hypothetical protein Nther_2440 [Natranaerobius thermophilus JW/NM-WN-LF]
MQMLVEGTELEHDTECFINCECQYHTCEQCDECSEQCVGQLCGGAQISPTDD